MRIQKYFSEQGILSRRETEAYILAGKISVNGEVVKDLGRQIDPDKDTVKIIDGKGKKDPIAKKEAVLINKPRGIVSSRIRGEGKTIYELFPKYLHLNITGRLDKESDGLLLLTNDGVLAKKITGEKHEVEKEYHVSVREAVEASKLARLAKGVRLSDGMTLPAVVEKRGMHEFSIVLREGRNHQIRRMADVVHLTVTRLTRVRIGTLSLRGLSVGAARVLTPAEIESFKK
jgi:pseudouridine synthase